MITFQPDDHDHLQDVLRHIRNVRESCELLGSRLVKAGEPDMGLELVALGQIHDYSKLHNQLEFTYLRTAHTGTPEFRAAFQSHVSTNLHHPEAWHGIEEMPRVYVAEMICDWKARSSEFGTDLMGWIKSQATERFQFSKSGKVYKDIKELTGLLLDNPFK